MRTRLFFYLSWALFTASVARAAMSVTLNWDPSSDPNAVGYKAYYGVASGTYTNSITVGNTNQATIAGLVPGTTYYFSATAVNSSGVESDFSNEASYTVPWVQSTAVVFLDNLSQTYSGMPRPASAATTPDGLTVELTYNGTTNVPVNAGTYLVVANASGRIGSTNWTGSATNLLVVDKAVASVTLGGLSQTYDGSAKATTVSTTPAGLVVNVSYNGAADLPMLAGDYQVAATINDPNYQGSVSETLTISPASASIALEGLARTFDGTARAVSATTTPSGLAVTITYNGNAAVPTNAGTYAVVATIANRNYTGSLTNSLIIDQAQGTVTLKSLTQTYDGTPRVVTATTSPANLPVAITYDSSPTAPTGSARYTVEATITDPNYQGSATGTLTVKPTPPGRINIQTTSQSNNGRPNA